MHSYVVHRVSSKRTDGGRGNGYEWVMGRKEVGLRGASEVVSARGRVGDGMETREWGSNGVMGRECVCGERVAVWGGVCLVSPRWPCVRPLSSTCGCGWSLGCAPVLGVAAAAGVLVVVWPCTVVFWCVWLWCDFVVCVFVV